jgi:hypothetical protein
VSPLQATTIVNARVFDGTRLRSETSVRFADGIVTDCATGSTAQDGDEVIDAEGGTICRADRLALHLLTGAGAHLRYDHCTGHVQQAGHGGRRTRELLLEPLAVLRERPPRADSRTPSGRLGGAGCQATSQRWGLEVFVEVLER